MALPEWFDREWDDCVWERRELLEVTDMSEAFHATVSRRIRKARTVTIVETLDRDQPH